MNKIFTAQPIALPEDLIDPTGPLYEDVYINEINLPNGKIMKELVETNKFYIRGSYISKNGVCINNVDIMVDPNTVVDVPVCYGVDLATQSSVTYCNGGYVLNED